LKEREEGSFFSLVIPSEARDLTIEIKSSRYSKVRSLTRYAGFGMTYKKGSAEKPNKQTNKTTKQTKKTPI